MLKREEVERIKEKYPKGTPIRLYSMEGEHTVPPGSRGVVDHVDDIGQIHMKWENGSSLALNVEEDRFDIITQQDEISEKKEQEFIDRINEILGKTDFLTLKYVLQYGEHILCSRDTPCHASGIRGSVRRGLCGRKLWHGHDACGGKRNGVRHKSTCLGNIGLGVSR